MQAKAARGSGRLSRSQRERGCSTAGTARCTAGRGAAEKDVPPDSENLSLPTQQGQDAKAARAAKAASMARSVAFPHAAAARGSAGVGAGGGRPAGRGGRASTVERDGDVERFCELLDEAYDAPTIGEPGVGCGGG